MDAPRGSVKFEGTNELQRLRRRAYGPDADIAGDAVAQLRLAELEGAQRRALTPAVDAAAGNPAAVSERVLLSNRAEGRIADSPSIDGPPPAPWWRGRRGLAILGGVVAALALIAALLPWIPRPLADESTPIPTDTSTALPVPDGGAQPPAPDAVLALVSIGAEADEPRDPRGTLALLGLNVDELRQYQNFDGIKVWSGQSRSGMVCLFVVLDDREASSAQGCSPDGLEPTADMEWFQNEGLSRYVLKGDHVERYTYVRNVPPQG